MSFDPAADRLRQDRGPYPIHLDADNRPSTLPPGLELIVVKDIRDTARVTGTPKEAGTYTFRIDV